MAGPMPGSTPTAVPSTTPIRANSRLIGVRASTNPDPSWLRASMASDPARGQLEQDAAGQQHAEGLDEQQPDDHRRDGSGQQRPEDAAGAEGPGHHEVGALGSMSSLSSSGPWSPRRIRSPSSTATTTVAPPTR